MVEDEDNSSSKTLIVKEELHDMDMDDIRNLEDLLRIVFILNYSLTMESLLEILTKTKSQEFYKLIDVDSVTNFIGENIYSISMWNIVNQ